MSATETAAPATAPTTVPATGGKRTARGAKAAAKPAPAKPVTPVEAPAPAVLAGGPPPVDPVTQIRAAAFADMTAVAQRVFARDLPPEAIANGVHAARAFWTLDGFTADAIAHMCAAVFAHQPSDLPDVVEERRAAAQTVLTALEPIALAAAAAVRFARDGEAFDGVPDDVVAQVRKLTGIGEARARRGVLVTLAEWQGAGVGLSACDRIARALFGSTGRGQRARAWQVVSRVANGAWA